MFASAIIITIHMFNGSPGGSQHNMTIWRHAADVEVAFSALWCKSAPSPFYRLV